MVRKCKWCRAQYDTRSGSSLYCDQNPKREKNLFRRPMKPRIVRIGCLVL